jgi:putative phage-type endonuclease
MNLKDRKLGIGGSECAAVLGLSKWKTPLQVWLDKLSEEDPSKEDNDAMWWGRELEPLVIKKYEEQTGNKVDLLTDTLGNQLTIINEKYPWLRAHVDGVVKDKKLIIEAKTTRFFMDEWGEPGTDQIPNEYLIQCAHYCIVLDHFQIHGQLFPIEQVDIAALGSTSDFRIYHYVRNKNLEEQIISRTKSFWENNVLANIPPDPINKEDLNKLYNICKDQPIIADSRIANKIESLLSLRDQINSYEEVKELLENEIKLYMKENSELIDISGKILATWKASNSKSLDQKKLKESNIDLSSYYVEKQKRTFLIKK